MKIRTDFVTNSSSSSFIVARVKSWALREMFGFETQEELDYAIEGGIEELTCCGEEPAPFTSDFENIAEFFTCVLGEPYELSDRSIQAAEIAHAEFEESGYGPFEYVKIKKGTKLVLRLDETCGEDSYKNENISGMEFVFINKPDEYEDYSKLEETIVSRGAYVGSTVSEKTNFVITASLTKNKRELKKIREMCIPILTEMAFRYRYMDLQYDDIYEMACEVLGMEDESQLIEWFEKYGYFEYTVESWNGKKWSPKHFNLEVYDNSTLEIEGKSIVTTGLDENEEKRITEIVQKNGGMIKGSVSGKTDILIVNEKYDHVTVKYQKTKELIKKGKNIQIITYKQFMKQYH